ncbi:MAG: ornithine carbamoyltransferase [Nitrospinae bacterium]|nr:ornithine carbamoyltransferase [Nitrospinota bacterium]
MKKLDYLTGEELSAAQTIGLIEEALVQKQETAQGKLRPALSGKNFALIFEKHSTRTRVSFEAGLTQLGASTIFLAPNDTQIARGETPADSAKVLSEYVDGIVVRTYAHARVEEIAANASVPVINGLTDLHHPCQALADFLTMREHYGALEGLKLAYLGDGNNVLHSLLIVGALIGVHVSAACPNGYWPDSNILEQALGSAQESNAQIHITEDVEEACAGAHAVYTDVWASMGQEDENERRQKALAPYQVNERVFRHANKEAVFMHCLPAHRGEEVTAGVIDGPRSVVFTQAGNRLHAQKILLQILAGGNDGA